MSKNILKGFKHKDIFTEYKEEISCITASKYAEIFNFTRQNISKRFTNESELTKEEEIILIRHLEQLNQTHSSLYKKLAGVSNHVDIPVKSSVSASCGNGVDVYDENIHDNLSLPNNLLDYFNANKSMTEIIYAEGDSMLPEIQDRDMLLIDKSKTDIKEGNIYVFSYDGQPMCKHLKKKGKYIVATSQNPSYPPFIIEPSLNFKIVGRVVGVFHPVG